MNIAYINLDRNTERNEHILNEIKNNITNYKTLKRIQAVDGKDFTDEEKEYWGSRKNFRTMCNIKERVYGRVGCMLSHKKLLEYALENELDNILILEDDVNIRDIPDINDIDDDNDGIMNNVDACLNTPAGAIIDATRLILVFYFLII